MGEIDKDLEIPQSFAEKTSISLPPMLRRIEKFEGKNGSPAGKLAAKKAIVDILPIEVDERSLRILKNPSGEPVADYSDEMYWAMLSHGICDVAFSITHYAGVALAFAVIDRVDFDRLSVGVDLTSEERMRRFVGKRNVLRFTSEELDEANDDATSIARRFSVKESVAKALGTGFSQGIFGTDIHTHEQDGNVSVLLTGQAQTRANELGFNGWEIAIANDGPLVASYVIAHS